HDLAGEAQVVEPLGPVALDPLGKHALPFPGGRFEALQLLDQLGKPSTTLAARARRRVEPGLQEAMPLLLADRADLRSPPLARVAVDARKQAARAPQLPTIGLELTGDRESAGAQGLERDRHGGS